MMRVINRLVSILCIAFSAHSFAANDAAPDFNVELESQQTSLKAVSESSWVYLDFWASWCGPCRYSFPFMNELQSEFGDKGLKVITVNVDSDRLLAEQFLQDNPANFTVVYDPKGEIASAYKVPAMPSSYLIKNGEIVGMHVGFKTSDQQELKEQISVLIQP
ncbi:TlpA family protein disulfide reductase [Vibrio sp. F74]|uniref:TlpA family protein disulfide reductase n=1 Tax=Vibrio sp. F74 TaxID=700020 RepID=UPI0035F5E448